MRKLLLGLVLLLPLSGCTLFQSPRDDQGNVIEHPIEEQYRPLVSIRLRPPAVKNFGSDTAITTVGAYCYVRDLDEWLGRIRPGSWHYHSVMLHEQAHSRRQLATGTVAWVARYGVDAKFALLEEQIGYYYEITTRRQRERIVPEAYALTLSKYKILTGSLISYEDALAWVHDVLAGRWTPPN